MARKPLVEAAPKYELYATWLADEDNGLEETYDIPADVLQVACRNYSAFQKSDVNREANAARAAEREEAPAKAAKTTTKKSAGKSKAKVVEDDEDDTEDDVPAPKTTAKKAPAKRSGKGKTAAAF